MNKYEELVRELKNRILSGEFPPGGKFPSDFDLAEEYGVSKLTVNKAVSILACDGFIRRGIRRSPSIVLNDLPARETPLLVHIGEIIPPTITHIIQGIQRGAFMKGYMLALITERENMENTLHKICNDRNVKGIFVSSFDPLTPPKPLPVVYIDTEYPRHPERNTVNCDNYTGGRLAMEELISKGHRNILILSIAQEVPHMKERRRGMTDVMRENGIADAEKRIFYMTMHETSYELNRLKEMQRNFPGFTAVATDSDDTAALFQRECARRGIRIPGDISVTGFGNLTWVRHTYHVTTVDQQPFEMGRCAAEVLIDLIEGRRSAPVHETVEVRLVPGSSVKIILPS